jgi:hypothetical protein
MIINQLGIKASISAALVIVLGFAALRMVNEM